MTPEILSALRSILIAAGAFAVGKGWIDATGLDSVVGGVVALGAAIWGIWAKRPTTPEAQKVATNVASSPAVPAEVKSELNANIVGFVNEEKAPH